jgi:hypothetical protein
MRWSWFLLAACADSAVPEPSPPACTTERSTEDRADDSLEDQIRVLYVTPSDGRDDAHDTSGRICNSVRAFATWFHEASGQALRFDTIDGQIDIGFVRLAIDDTTMRGDDPSNADYDRGIAFVRERIERELALADHKLYAVYYEGTSTWACGAGAWPPLIPGRVGAMYLRAQPPGQAVPCGDSYPWGRDDLVPEYVDYAMLHELVHSLGLAPSGSPNEHATGHVFDAGLEPERDLMYAQRAGMPDPFWATTTRPSSPRAR